MLQDDLDLSLHDPPTLASQSAGTTGVSHGSRLSFLFFIFSSSSIVSVSVFYVWPKIIILPVSPREAKRLDSPVLDGHVNKARAGPQLSLYQWFSAQGDFAVAKGHWAMCGHFRVLGLEGEGGVLLASSG